MIRKYIAFFKRLAILADIGILCLAFVFAYYLRNTLDGLYPIRAYLKLLPVLSIVWVYLLHSFGMYKSFRVRFKRVFLLIILKSSFVGFFIFSSILYLLKLEYVSRTFIVLVFVILALLTMLEKTLLIAFFRDMRRKGLNYRSILIVGTGKRAKHFLSIIEEHKEFGFRVLGLIDEDAVKKSQVLYGYKVLGTFEDMPEIIHNNVVDEVVFVVPRSWLGRIEHLLHFCENEGLLVHLAVDYFELKLSRAHLENLLDVPLLTFGTAPNKLDHLLIKRFVDIVVSAVALIVLSPLFLFVALLIKKTSAGPVFFKQERSSYNGRRFILYKFRTMVADAELKLHDLRHLNEMAGPVFKIKNDPRLTKIGKFLRKFSIDEFPQFWNVLKGDMSLVGPRPPIPSEVDKYDSWQRRRLSMRPGLTCLWQASGRNKISSFDEWTNLDLKYIDNWSLWLDVKIFFKTIPAVLFGRGAK